MNTYRVAESLLTLRRQINLMAPGRSRASDGAIGDTAHQNQGSASDHNPWVKDGTMGVVTAMDITDDPANGCSARNIVDELVINRDNRIKYIIWNKRIISSSVAPWVWRDYSGTNPHDKHFHISVGSSKALYDAPRAWKITKNGFNKVSVRSMTIAGVAVAIRDNQTIEFISKASLDGDGANGQFGNFPCYAPLSYTGNTLDDLANAGTKDNWFGIVTDKLGKPYVQKASDPCPGAYISQTSLHLKDKNGKALPIDSPLKLV